MEVVSSYAAFFFFFFLLSRNTLLCHSPDIKATDRMLRHFNIPELSTHSSFQMFSLSIFSTYHFGKTWDLSHELI